MKYLFINVVAGVGSTGKIIVEAARELEAAGHTCRIAYGRAQGDCRGIQTMAIGTPMDYKLHAVRHRIFGTGGFGSTGATRDFLKEVRAYDPDVIWLHNLHGYYLHVGLLFDYLRTCGKQLRWTLHDCWAFTGNCPYFSFVGCDRWKTGCGSCPQKGLYPKAMLDATARNYQKKKDLFTGIPNLTLEVPSRWLAGLVKESFLKDYPVTVVPNKVDPAVFHPIPSDLRKQWGLEDKFILLSAANVWEPRKGLTDLVALSALLPADCKLVLVGIDGAQAKTLPRSILALPRTANQEELAKCYTAADVYLCPSREETFGMTVLEAACCGTTPIVYRGTACQEVAQAHGGIAVEPGAQHLLEAVIRLKQKKEAL